MSEVERELSNRQPRPPIALQGRGHGPVWVLRVLSSGDHQAECVQCGWKGPDRGDLTLPQAVLMTEDDAVHHLHAVGSNCGRCEACLSDGCIRVASLHREAELSEWSDYDVPNLERDHLAARRRVKELVFERDDLRAKVEALLLPEVSE